MPGVTTLPAPPPDGAVPALLLLAVKPQVLREAVVGIIVHENGGNPYTDQVIDEGVRRALA